MKHNELEPGDRAALKNGEIVIFAGISPDDRAVYQRINRWGKATKFYHTAEVGELSPAPAPNPRFVWNMGAIHTRYPDMPAEMLDEDSDGIKLWDRQEKQAVATVHKDYYQAMCLELSKDIRMMPFTHLENWFNSLSNSDLESEGMTPTGEAYHL